jgi:hypothetical protein
MLALLCASFDGFDVGVGRFFNNNSRSTQQLDVSLQRHAKLLFDELSPFVEVQDRRAVQRGQKI